MSASRSFRFPLIAAATLLIAVGAAVLWLGLAEIPAPTAHQTVEVPREAILPQR